MDKLKTLIGAFVLLFASASQATIITVDYSGSVTNLGVELSGDLVNMGDTVAGSFTYDSDLGPSDTISAFSISIGSAFTASHNGSYGYFRVQNDQQNGSATLPADGFTVGSQFTSTPLNGHSSGYMQFGVLKDNAAGQLWDDTFLPDLSDWARISLADINKADWHWMDFGLTTEHFRDDQIRWDVSSFSATDVSVPEPAAFVLMSAGLFGLVAVRRRKRRQ